MTRQGPSLALHKKTQSRYLQLVHHGVQCPLFKWFPSSRCANKQLPE